MKPIDIIKLREALSSADLDDLALQIVIEPRPKEVIELKKLLQPREVLFAPSQTSWDSHEFTFYGIKVRI